MSNQSKKSRYIIIGSVVIGLFLLSKLIPKPQAYVVLARDVSQSAIGDKRFNETTKNACAMAIKEAGSSDSKLKVIKYADFAKSLGEIGISSYKKNVSICSDTAFEQSVRGTSGLIAVQKTLEVLETSSRDYPNAAPVVIFALQADETEQPPNDRNVATNVAGDVSDQRAALAQGLIEMANSIKAKGGQIIIIPGSYYHLERDFHDRSDFPDNVKFCDVLDAKRCPQVVKMRIAKAFEMQKNDWIAHIFGQRQSMATTPSSSELAVSK
jgi:hypothetical protein